MNIKPPDNFITPPEYIYTDKFHLTLFSDEDKYLDQKPHEYLFRKIIKHVKLLQRNNAKSFCQSIYGIHMFRVCKKTDQYYKQSLCQTLLYLDSAPTLPIQFVDTGCITPLMDKYHIVSDTVIFGTMFDLISSRKCGSF